MEQKTNFITKYEDVKNQTTEEYFNNNKFSIDAFKSKYAQDKEQYVQAVKRVCDFIASAEKTDELKKYWSERWFDEIYNDWWHPAGSIMQGAGSGRKVSLANCTTISLGKLRNEEWDNLESIFKNTSYTAAKCAAYRQGLGVDFSSLRPSGTKVSNSANESTGAVHWMKFVDSIGYFVGQKGRIPAMLFSLSCDHPDVEQFIEIKKDYTKIQNANISVQCTEEFYKAIEKDDDWELKFEIPEMKKGDKVYIDIHSIDSNSIKEKETGKYYKIATHNKNKEIFTKIVKAKKIMELIAKNMQSNAEPGIQNIDIARKYSNSDALYDENDEYDSRILSTNACVTGDTEILTRHGYKRIDKLVNQNIDIWNGFEWSKVTPLITEYNQDILNITLSDGRSIKCTKYHRFILSSDYQGGIYEKQAIDLKIGDKIIKYNFPVLDFEEGLNINAYSQGFYSGDGNENLKSIWVYEPKFCCLNRLNGNTGNEFEILSGIKRKMVSLDFNPLPKDFVPLEWNIKNKIEWLAGLVDADGTIVKEGSIQLVSINHNFLLDLQKLLSLCGVNSKVLFAQDEGFRPLPDGKGGYKDYFCQRSWRICIGACHVQNLVNLGLKCNRLDLDKSPNRECSHFIKIISIKEDEIAPIVFCFNEPLRHYGVFNGILAGQCSEQYLSRESLCVLASANCGRFSVDQNIYIKQLEKIGKSINRFLDNVNECELIHKTFATPHQELAIKKLRRTGGGFTNVDAWLFKKQLEYGSDEGNLAIEDFAKWYNYWMYISTEELGREKGDFILFDKDKWKNAPFINNLIKESKKLNEKFSVPILHGNYARNVTVSSIAPTGTLSLMFRDFIFSYGIEPSFFLYYWKRTRISGKYEYYFCVPRVVRDMFLNKGLRIPINSDCIKDEWDGKNGKIIAEYIDKYKHFFKYKDSTQIKALDKLELMSKVMKWVDSSISVTYLLSEDSSWKDVYEFILLAHKKEVKSIAAFPDKKMYGIVSNLAFKDLAFKLKSEGVEIHPQNFTEQELKELNISKDNITIEINKIIPERLTVLDADIYIVQSKGEKFIITIGLQNGQPYEIFGGHLNKNNFNFSHKTGKLKKVKQGQYALEVGDNIIEDFSKQFTPVEQILFRMSSLMLRHGVSIQFIIEQLHKATDDITSLASVAARVLKKYIKNGEIAHGQHCPNCSTGQMIFMDGCSSCSNCGFSKCS